MEIEKTSKFIKLDLYRDSPRYKFIPENSKYNYQNHCLSVFKVRRSNNGVYKINKQINKPLNQSLNQTEYEYSHDL